MTIAYRQLHTADEVAQIPALWQAVWNTSDRDTLTSHMAVALHHAGGLVLGAFDDEMMIAFALSFPGIIDGKLLHWSHAAGVLPAYQGRGIGTAIKWLQRDMVRQAGFDCIAWTFDPLQRGNARFNLSKLGVDCNLYHVDIYGSLQDNLNMGLPSDRFEARWWLNSERVNHYAKSPPAFRDITGIHRTLSQQADGSPGPIIWPSGTGQTLVEIPDNINQMRVSQINVAQQWRLRTREVFTRLFAEGFVTNDFVSEEQAREDVHHWYVLERRSQ